MKLKEKDLLQLGLRQFIRVYEDNMATETWTFDLDKSTKGPIKVEIQWKHKIDEDWGDIQKTSKAMRSIERNQKKGKKIPLTHQKWINPANGKEVGYQRAKALSLI